MRTVSLIVPTPADPPRLDRFLAGCVLGLSRKQAKGLIDAGQVRLNGRTVRKAATSLHPGQQVEIDYRPSMLALPLKIGRDRLLHTGPNWFAINKPPGVPSHRAGEEVPGVPELLEAIPGHETAAPVHRLDRETSGVLVLATSKEARAALSELFATRAIEKTYRAVVSPPPKGDSGRVDGPGDMTLRWQRLRGSEDGTRAELAVFPEQGRTHQIRIQLAHLGSPIVGDMEHGQPLPGGSPRMALHCERLSWADVTLACPPPEAWGSLLDPVLLPPSARKTTGRPVAQDRNHHHPPNLGEVKQVTSSGDRRRSKSSRHRNLAVSAATARIVRAGHPWVIRDGDTGDLGLFKCGDLAELVDPRGLAVATALIDPSSAVCARVVGMPDDRPLSEAPWLKRALAAASKRARNVASADTDAYRVIHGEADGLPGLFVDRWGDVLVATRTTPLADLFSSTYPALLEATQCTALWEQDHFEDLRSRGAAPGDASRGGRWVVGSRDVLRWTVRESGLRYYAEPTAGLTHGLYTDQRSNRTLLRRLIEADPSAGESVANLFSHTAAFSVACAVAGAKQVTSVDLARRYSEWASQNLRLNGLDPADHPVVAEGAMEWLGRTRGLSGVILDPPAHARSKTSRAMDWNARRDYRGLVAAAANSLGPRGWLLCCINLKGLKRDWLSREVNAGLKMAKKRPEGSLTLAPPSPDHPRRKGFPEGRPFHGLLVRTCT